MNNDTIKTSSKEIDGALIYCYDCDTQVGDDIYGTVICNFEKDFPGRCSHAGPVCMEYMNGDIVAFHSNTDGHNTIGWSEYAISKDGGKTWSMYNKLPYSYEVFKNTPERPSLVEGGLVTEKGTVILFLSHFKRVPGDEEHYIDMRIRSGIIKSYNHGKTWTDYELFDKDFVGYPADTAVNGKTNFVLMSVPHNPHVLYVSTDGGQTWIKRSELNFKGNKWYGTICMMPDGRMLVGVYDDEDEDHFYYCISNDNGYSWSEQKHTYVDKKIRNGKMIYFNDHYYLHGRAGQSGEHSHRFVLYQSDDGKNWKDGLIITKTQILPYGYSCNCIINKYKDIPNELIVEYSVTYEQWNTNEYVFFIKSR